MTVHWISPVPTHYHAHLLRSMAAELPAPLRVHFLRATSRTHPWRSSFGDDLPARICEPSMGVDPVLRRLVATEPDSLFVVAGWQGSVVVPLLVDLMLRRRQFCIWTDTPKLAQRRGLAKAAARAVWLRLLLRSAAAVLGTGRPALAALERLGAAPGRLHDFPFAVDLDAFHPEVDGARPDARRELVFVSAGRLVNELKGFDLALRALARVRAAAPVRFRYRIAGTGPDREALERLAAELGLHDLVEFAGWVEASELPRFFRSGHVLLHPARVDPFPNAVLEAMACGIPVVGSDAAGSVLDRVQDRVNGFIHRSEDADELASIIARIMAQPDVLQALGERARARAAEWPVERNIETLRRIIDQVTASRSSARRGSATPHPANSSRPEIARARASAR